MFKSREHKLSWSSLFGQDDWILASFFSYFFFLKTQKKESANIQPFWPNAWTNIFHEDPYKSDKGRR